MDTQTDREDIDLAGVHHAIDRLWSQYARDRRELLQLRNYPSARLDLASTQQLLDEIAVRIVAAAGGQS